MSISVGVVDTGSLTDGLQNLHSAEEVRGALEAVLLPRVGAEDATAIARTLVVDAKYNSSAAIADVDIQALAELDIPVGQRKVVLRAIFAGGLPAAAMGSPGESMVHVPAPAPAAPSVQHGVVKVARDFKREWPLPDEYDLLGAAE